MGSLRKRHSNPAGEARPGKAINTEFGVLGRPSSLTAVALAALFPKRDSTTLIVAQPVTSRSCRAQNLLWRGASVKKGRQRTDAQSAAVKNRLAWVLAV